MWPKHPEEISDEDLQSLCFGAVARKFRPHTLADFSVEEMEGGKIVQNSLWDTAPLIGEPNDAEKTAIDSEISKFSPYEHRISFEVLGRMVHPNISTQSTSYKAYQRWLGPEFPDEDAE